MDFKKQISGIESAYPSGSKGALVPEQLDEGEVDFLVFGLNPAEARDDKEADYTDKFYFIHPSKMKTKGQARWTNKLKSLFPDGNVLFQAELIYWTSRDRSDLESKIGKLKKGNIYFDASLEINCEILKKYNSAIPVFLGLGHEDVAVEMFGASETEVVLEGSKGVLLKRGIFGERVFYIARHPSSVGITNKDKEEIKEYFTNLRR